MRHLLISGLLVTLIILSGCNDDQSAMLGPANSGQNQTTLTKAMRPFEASATGSCVTVGLCDVNYLKVSMSMTGNALHLGQFNYSGEMCVYWPTGPNISFSGTLSGLGTFEAANGDELFIAFSGDYHIPFPPANPPCLMNYLDGTYTIVGGTGRFTEASGEGTISGTEEICGTGGTHSMTSSLKGVIVY